MVILSIPVNIEERTEDRGCVRMGLAFPSVDREREQVPVLATTARGGCITDVS